ncbi:hypothetical protein [Nonomuraea lactucae]|uniref:hypothetical protein n=1 Tax=Nonomuraea lactucae TaxID=2249762 RepID=UPI000DE3B4C7|nr:hypothetical protein [Nonomuraea lactucae]
MARSGTARERHDEYGGQYEHVGGRSHDQGGAPKEDLATRHLCAGVYLDPAFCGVVLRRVHNDTARMVAPSYGFDLVPLVGHAWLAWLLDTVQHLGVLAVFAVGFAVRPPAALVVACGLGFWWLSGVTARSAVVVLPLRAKATADRWLRRTRWLSDSDELREQVRLFRLSGAGCLALAVTPPLLAGFARVPLGELARAAGLLALLIAVVVGGRGAVQQLCLNGVHGADSAWPRRLTLRLRAIREQQDHPYVVYRRPTPPEPDTDAKRRLGLDPAGEDGSPFVGSGELVHRWLPPLTVQLLKAHGVTGIRGHAPMAELEDPSPPFRAHELIAYLKTAMEPMGDSADPTGLRGFRVRDRLYIAEADVPPRAEWLRRPVGQADIDRTIDEPYDDVHHFLEIGASATGELVTTVFLRVTVKGRALSLDFAACALTRTPVEYHLLDAFAESGASAVVRSTLRGLFRLPAEVVRVWRLAEAPLILGGAVRARRNRLLRPRRGMAIGPRLSVREDKSTPWEQAQLDEVTIYDHVKLIEQRLLKAAEDFLRRHGIDTSSFERRAASIINTGVLNMGGKTEIKQSAIGDKAQVRADSRDTGAHSGHSTAGEGDQG